ncbi:MAG: formate dehydrogenase subunit gamma [Steroidobacteraceae bacterium]|jgi:formate dehydrogenase subunit gamma
MNDRINTIVARLGQQPGPLLLVLHAIQDELGFIPTDAIPLVAQGLNLSRAEVHGVVSFYHYFRHSPPGRHTVRICRAESCQAMNGTALEQQAQQNLGIGFNETTSDGAISLEPVYCLGACACSPAVMINDELHGRVTPARLDELLAQCRERT